MGLLVLGISHREAPVALRERLTIAPAALPRALGTLAGYTREGVILSTCNRVEVYAVTGHHRSGRDNVLRFLAEETGLAVGELSRLAYDRWHADTVRHLFRVAAGLDSMIVGEPQILGQVRDALDVAARAGSAGPLLSRLFQHALRVGKAARSNAGISQGAASVSSAAVALARELIGGLAGRVVLVVGSGQTGALTARLLRGAGAAELLIANRSLERARALADECGGRALPFERLEAGCALADIVLTCTAAPRPILSRALLAAATRDRAERPLLVVDLAVPRDVEPEAAGLPGLRLCNLDDLQARVEETLASRREESAAVEELIERELARFLQWWETLGVAPTIRALREHAEAIRQEEVERTLGRLSGLSERDRDAIDALTRAIVNKLLHEPITRLKQQGGEGAGEGFVRAVHELFPLDEVPA